MEGMNLISKDKTDEDKVDKMKRLLRKRTTFKKGKDKNSLWRRRWVLVKTIESSFNCLSWIRADNDLSNSESDLEDFDNIDKDENLVKDTSFSFFRSARRKLALRRKKELKNEKNIRELVKDSTALSGNGWVVRKKAKSKTNSETNKGKVEHICSECKKVYGDFNSLKKHKRIHGEKKHACPEKGCGKAFSEASKLKRHMMVHTGEKPFKCPYPSCRRDFGLNYNLRKHIQQIHTGELLACSVEGCDRKFMDQNAMKQHIKYYH